MRLAILLTLASAAALAQVRPQLMEDASKENLPSQKLGIDDLVAVSVYDAPELTRTVRVEADGAIHLPLLTNGVAAAGLFAHDVEASLVEALQREQILVDPVVKGDGGGISQPSDFGDGRCAQAAYFSSGGHRDAARRAGAGRGA